MQAALGIFLAALALTCNVQDASARRIFQDHDLIATDSDDTEAQEEEVTDLVATSDGPYGRCGYDKSDVYDAEMGDVSEHSVYDPRSGFKTHGLVWGTAAKMVQLIRTIANNRVFMLQLTGRQAVTLVERQYGIVQTQVPKTCFLMMKKLLVIENMTWYAIKSRRRWLRDFIDRILPTGCSWNATDQDKALGADASDALQILRWGYWGLYPNRTDERFDVISARVLDERRYEQGRQYLRQIWHYGLVYVLTNFDALLRQKYMWAREVLHVGEQEKRHLVQQRRALTKISTLNDARIEFVELDNLGNCVSAHGHDPEHLLVALEGSVAALLRVTVFFRERIWQTSTRKLTHFFRHPFTTTRKTYNRWRDEWHRTSVGHKFVMLMRPVALGLSITGIVLGALSGGAVTIGKLVADATLPGLLGEVGVITLEVSLESFFVFLLGRLFYTPVSIAGQEAQNELMAQSESSKPLQKLYAMLDDDDIIKNYRRDMDLKLRAEVEKVMESEKVQRLLRESPEEEQDLLEPIARHHSNVLIRGSFIAELAPHVMVAYERRLNENKPGFGWLHWSRWRLYRKGENAKDLLNRTIRFVPDDTNASNRTARVAEVGSKWSTLGMGGRKVFVQQVQNDGSVGDPEELVLNDTMKARISVYDAEAYRLSLAGWLFWHDWVEYRGDRTTGKHLQKKEVFIDGGVDKCKSFEDPCLQSITLSGEGLVGFPVTTTWKFWGKEDRGVYLDMRGEADHVCTRDGFELSEEVKDCLRVRDHGAFTKYVTNQQHREAIAAWKNGTISANVTLAAEVVKQVREQQRIAGGRIDEGAINRIIEAQSGEESRALEQTDAPQLEGSAHADEDDVRELEAAASFLEDGFAEEDEKA